jgi:hypothetical protein
MLRVRYTRSVCRQRLRSNALVSSKAFPPVARAPTAVGNRDDLYADGRFPKDDYEWKAPQHHSARTKIV